VQKQTWQIGNGAIRRQPEPGQEVFDQPGLARPQLFSLAPSEKRPGPIRIVRRARP
jgi:hypothetical protein